MTKKKEKRHEPFGRPTKYHPSFCQMLVDHMAHGYSFESFAAVAKVHKETLYAWSSEGNPSFIADFSEAKKIAFDENLLFWEKQGIENLLSFKGTIFNTSLWIFNMKNRHKWSNQEDKDKKDDKKPGDQTPQTQVVITLPSNGRESIEV